MSRDNINIINRDNRDNKRDELINDIYERISLLHKYTSIDVVGSTYKEVTTVKYEDLIKILNDFSKEIKFL